METDNSDCQWLRSDDGREHVAGRARSAVAPPLICEKLGAGDVCRGHLLFYPSIGM
jgi:hypothetical protein